MFILDTFFSFFILGVPGVLTYLFYKWIGDSTSRKQTNIELLAITSLLWVPTILIAILIFNLLRTFANISLNKLGIEYFQKFNVSHINSIDDLLSNINTFLFISVFTLIILISSFAVSLIAPYLYSSFINVINWIRSRKGYAKINPGISVWHKFFILKNSKQIKTDDGEFPIVVQISYLDDPERVLYGCLELLSTDGNQKKQFILGEEDEWTNFIKEFQEEIGEKIPFGSVFFEADSKLLVREIDQVELKRLLSEVNDNE